MSGNKQTTVPGDKVLPPRSRNYDLCVSVLSENWKWLGHGVEEASVERNLASVERNHASVERNHASVERNLASVERNLASVERNLRHVGAIRPPFPIIIVYAQWVRLSSDDPPPDIEWLNQFIGDVHIFNMNRGIQHKPMSEMVQNWLFTNPREFDEPYVKRLYSTDATDLSTNGWVKWMVDHIDKVCAPNNGLWLSIQMQATPEGTFAANKGNGTAYSWRESRMICTIDCFHDSRHEQEAQDWEATTDSMIGEIVDDQGLFSRTPHGFLWGSFGDWDLEAPLDIKGWEDRLKVWNKYHDSQEKYDRLKRIRARYDPQGTFTPNPFCVPRAQPPSLDKANGVALASRGTVDLTSSSREGEKAQKTKRSLWSRLFHKSTCVLFRIRTKGP